MCHCTFPSLNFETYRYVQNARSESVGISNLTGLQGLGPARLRNSTSVICDMYSSSVQPAQHRSPGLQVISMYMDTTTYSILDSYYQEDPN